MKKHVSISTAPVIVSVENTECMVNVPAALGVRSPPPIVEVTTADGILVGTIDRVGRDHLDLAVHEAGTARRESAVRDVLMLPIERIVIVRA